MWRMSGHTQHSQETSQVCFWGRTAWELNFGEFLGPINKTQICDHCCNSCRYSIEIITEWDLILIHSTNKHLILIMCEALQGIQWKIRHGLCPQGAYSLVWKK